MKIIILIFALIFQLNAQNKKQDIHALYIPLADHYAALVAYEKYSKKMKYANFTIEKMQNWNLLRAYFQSEEVDMAYVMSPLAMNMYSENPHFKWIGLMHRDGNALAINDLIYKELNLEEKRINRKPDAQVANALKKIHKQTNKPTQIAMPHLLATHSVILYKYLKENNATISFKRHSSSDVQAIAIAPPKSPAFIKSNNSRAIPAAFEQSLPWADVVETGNFGHVAWYSKDVMPSRYGHVECITLATNKAIKTKQKALKEVMYYIHKAGDDIEKARLAGGEKLEDIVNIVRKHIKAHTRDAIIASLDPTLNVINYKHLNVDKAGLKQIMDYAIEGKIINNKIDIDKFADESFGTNFDKGN